LNSEKGIMNTDGGISLLGLRLPVTPLSASHGLDASAMQIRIDNLGFQGYIYSNKTRHGTSSGAAPGRVVFLSPCIGGAHG